MIDGNVEGTKISVEEDLSVLIISKLPKYFSLKEVKKYFVKKGLINSNASFCGHKKHSCVVKFKTAEEQEKTQKLMKDFDGVYRKTQLHLEFVSKRQYFSEQENTVTKLKDEENDIDSFSRLMLCIAPYHNVDYFKQLEMKNSDAQNVLSKLSSYLKKVHSFKPEKPLDWDFNICQKLETIVPSPVIKQYRNKVAFSVGLNAESNGLSVGFRVGKIKSSYVDFSENIPIINQNTILVQQISESIVRQSSVDGDCISADFQPEMYWKSITVRTSCKDKVIVIYELAVTKENLAKLEELRNLIKNEYKERWKSTENFSAVYLKIIKKQKNIQDSSDLEFLFDGEAFYEQLYDYEFRISPEAFFQTNTKGAEKLYEKIKEIVESNICTKENTLLLDLCCGTGTIGICLSSIFKHVYGVEIVKSAVEDAIFNAKHNNIHNITFIANDVQKVLTDSWLKSIKNNFNDERLQIWAIIDPPRAGLHTNVLRCIRKNNLIKNVLYVACDPTSVISQLADLVRNSSRKMEGDKFKLTRCIPVDMFPQTKHFEMIFQFKR